MLADALVSFRFQDKSRYVSIVSQGMYKKLIHSIQSKRKTLTINSLREMLDKEKPLLYPKVPDYIDGMPVEQVNEYYIINGKRYFEGKDFNYVVEYFTFRLAFLRPLILFCDQGDKNYDIYVFETDYVDGEIIERYAHMVFKDGVMQDITCNGKKVYFGHEKEYDWRLYNLPLYGPCFLVEDGFNSYIYGRTSPVIRGDMFGNSLDPNIKYFKCYLSKSELFVSTGSDKWNLDHVYKNYGLRKELCMKEEGSRGFMPIYLMNTVLNETDTTNLRDVFRQENNIYLYKQYFTSKELESIIGKLKRVSNKEDLNKLDSLEVDVDEFAAEKVNEAMKRFVRDNFWCIFDCKDAEIILDEIRTHLRTLKKEKKEIRRSTPFKPYNYLGKFDVLFDNAENVLSVLAINVICETLEKIADLLETCTGDICAEISEHISNLTYPAKIKENLKNYEIYFMAVFGNFVKPEQFDKVEEIIRDMDNGVRRVHQFMMGKGKSAVITPLVTLDRCSKNEKICLVVPDHLLSQTEKTYAHLHLNDRTYDDFSILSLSQLFSFFESDYEYISQSTIIFDEFDMMYDPLSSVMNKVLEEEEWFDEQRLMEAINVVEDMAGTFQRNDRRDADKTYVQFLREALKRNLVRNVNYGMTPDSRIIVPYMRKDTPIIGSKFSSIIYSLVYTILFYKDQDYMLREIDYAYISKFYSDKVKQQFRINTKDVLEEYLYNYYLDHPEERRDFFIWYLLHILRNEILISSEVFNVNFLDLMTTQGVQVGYTGTVNLALPEKYDDVDYHPEIVRDFDELVNVYFAITGRSTVSKNECVPFFSKEDVFYLAKDYDCVIDLIAFFKDYQNEDLVKELAKYVPRKAFVFLDANDDKKMYFPEEDRVYNYDISVNAHRPFFFYSQKNSIGIDFKQPPRMKGLILINSKTTYTEVSQGIYRLRKLNKGHTIDIGFYQNRLTNNLDVYHLLLDNDRKAWEIRYPHFLIHRFKNLVRRYKNFPEGYTEQTRFAFQGDEWNMTSILKYLESKVGVEEGVLSDWVIERLYKEIKSLSFEQLYNVLLAGEGIETKIETEKQKALEMTREELYRDIEYRDDWYYLVVGITREEILEQFTLISTLLYEQDGYEFYISDNVYNNSWWSDPEVFFIEFLENKFLMEPLKVAMYYYDKFPMYDIDGKYLHNVEGLAEDISPSKFFDLFRNFYSEEVFNMWKEKTEIKQVNGLLKNFLFFKKSPYANLKKYMKRVDFEKWDYFPEPRNYELNRFILSDKVGDSKEVMVTFEPYTTERFV